MGSALRHLEQQSTSAHQLGVRTIASWSMREFLSNLTAIGMLLGVIWTSQACLPTLVQRQRAPSCCCIQPLTILQVLILPSSSGIKLWLCAKKRNTSAGSIVLIRA